MLCQPACVFMHLRVFVQLEFPPKARVAGPVRASKWTMGMPEQNSAVTSRTGVGVGVPRRRRGSFLVNLTTLL